MLAPAIVGERGNGFCVPAALVSGFHMDIADATALIRQHTGKSKVFGVTTDAIHEIMEFLGAVRVDVRGTTDALARTLPPGDYLLRYSGHVFTFSNPDGMVCDNRTVYPMPLARCSRLRRRRITHVWRIR